MRLRILLLYLCFFISGASALIYEIVWQRMLTLVIGLSTISVAAVLAAFLAGLAVGARLCGGLADRTRNAARLYAMIELGIGATAAASPWVIGSIIALFVRIQGWLDPGWFGSNLIRFVLAFLALIVPSALIGATVPVMSRLVAERVGSVAVGFGRFYAANTLGATVGAALAGFVLIRMLGMAATTHVAVAGNAVVALLAGVVGALPSPPAIEPRRAVAVVSSESTPLSRRRLALAGAALCGAIALGYEVIWLRVLAIYTLNSVYVFTMLVTVYLAALAIGAAIATRVARRHALYPFRLLAIMQTLLALLTPVMLAAAPSAAKLDIGAAGQSEAQIFLAEYLLAWAIVFVPTLLIGATLPLLVHLYRGSVEVAGQAVARVYFWNCIGTIVGAAATGTLLIPMLGLRDTTLMLAIVNFVVGAAAGVLDAGTERASRAWRLFTPAAACAFVLLAALLPPSFRLYRPSDGPDERVLYYAEGPSATVHVSEFARDGDTHRKLFVDSQAVAGTYPEIVTDQKMLAHLPLLLHPHPERALTVGFGTGGTSYSMLQHHVHVDCVEIEPRVPDGYKYFESENGLIVGPQHERHDFHLVLDDARSWLHLAREPYDVIVTDVTSIRYRGNGNLYTTDYFRLMQERLTSEGLGCAWVPATGITPQQLKVLIRSFHAVFRHTSAWYMLNRSTDFLILVGGPQALAIDLATVGERMSNALVRRDLAHIGLDEPFKLATCLLLAEEDVERYCDGGPVHTDDKPILDYLTHASFHQNTLGENLREMLAHRSDPARHITSWPGKDLGAARERWQRWYAAAGHLIEGHIQRRAGAAGLSEAARSYRAAAGLIPDDPLIAALVRECAGQRPGTEP